MQADGSAHSVAPATKHDLIPLQRASRLATAPGGGGRVWGESGAARREAHTEARLPQPPSPRRQGLGGHHRPWGSLTRGPRALAAGPPASRRPQAVDDVVRDAGALGHREHEVAGDGARVAHQEGPVALPLQQRHRLGPAQPPPVPARPVLGVELPGHGGRPPAGRTRFPPPHRGPPPPAVPRSAPSPTTQNGGPCPDLTYRMWPHAGDAGKTVASSPRAARSGGGGWGVGWRAAHALWGGGGAQARAQRGLEREAGTRRWGEQWSSEAFYLAESVPATGKVSSEYLGAATTASKAGPSSRLRRCSRIGFSVMGWWEKGPGVPVEAVPCPRRAARTCLCGWYISLGGLQRSPRVSPDGFPVSAARWGSLREARLACVLGHSSLSFFLQSCTSSSCSHLSCQLHIPAPWLCQYGCFHGTTGWIGPMSCSGLKIALQKKKFIFMQGSSLTVLLRGPANREELKFHWCHRGVHV